MTASVQSLAHDEFLALVDERREDVRAFIGWAESQESSNRSMYLAHRVDIADAREAAKLYPEEWWGVVVFTCFGTLNSTRAVLGVFAEPVDAEAAGELLEAVHFTRPTVGHHRIQQSLSGAKKALVAACRHSELLHEVLHTPRSFDDRYRILLCARLERWGRTTCFDLFLRTGAFGIAGQHYEPEIAYLAGSTGPKAGFHAVWGREVTAKTAAWSEGVLQAWHRNWREVADRVGADWSRTPYAPGDLENALCIYQERHRDGCARPELSPPC